MRVLVMLRRGLMYWLAMCALGGALDLIYWVLTAKFNLIGTLGGSIAGTMVVVVYFFEELGKGR